MNSHEQDSLEVKHNWRGSVTIKPFGEVNHGYITITTQTRQGENNFHCKIPLVPDEVLHVSLDPRPVPTEAGEDSV